MTRLDRLSWPIHTPRLTIRPLADEDLAAMWAYRSLEDVARWIGRAPATREAFEATYREPARRAVTFIVELRAADRGPSLVAPERDAGRPQIIGDVMISVEDGLAQAEAAEDARGCQAEIGWAFDPTFARRGYATEAVRAAINICFCQLGLRRVHAECFAANERSRRLMERLGMRREAVRRKSVLHRSGQWLDDLDYALLAEEWEDGRAHSPTEHHQNEQP